MITEERLATLLETLQKDGYLQVTDFAARMGVSAATIRRDLELLESEGKCIRKRGGAVPSGGGTTLEIPYDVKRLKNIEEKRRIARAAADLVVDGDAIILDAGSTIYELAHLLSARKHLTVVTNDLKIALILSSNPGITLIVAGGIVRPNVYSMMGNQVISFLRTLKVDKTFLGADAIHEDGVISNVILEEVEVKKAMLAAARTKIVLADSSKFQITGFCQVAELSTIDQLITGKEITPQTRELVEKMVVNPLFV
jgi:DeoR family transcriptional regulator, aga operon transcriptional repressor